MQVKDNIFWALYLSFGTCYEVKIMQFVLLVFINRRCSSRIHNRLSDLVKDHFLEHLGLISPIIIICPMTIRRTIQFSYWILLFTSCVREKYGEIASYL